MFFLLFLWIVAIIFSILIKWYSDKSFDSEFWLGVLAFGLNALVFLFILLKKLL